MNRQDHAAEIARVAAEVLCLPAQAACRLEGELRERYGGKRIRIAERPSVTPALVDSWLRSGLGVRQIAAEMGLHRSTIYRMLGSGQKVAARAGSRQRG